MKNFVRSLPGKVLLFVGTVSSAGLLLACAVSVFVMLQVGVYTKPKEAVMENVMRSKVLDDTYGTAVSAARNMQEQKDAEEKEGEDQENGKIKNSVIKSNKSGGTGETGTVDEGDFEPLIEKDTDTNLRFMMVGPDGTVVAKSESVKIQPDDAMWEYRWYFVVFKQDGHTSVHTYYVDDPSEIEEEGDVYELCAYVNDSNGRIADGYVRRQMAVDFAYVVRYRILALSVCMGLLTLAGFVALMSVSARRPGREELVPGPLNRIPADLLTALFVLTGSLGALLGIGMGDTYYFGSSETERFIGIVYMIGIYCLIMGSLGLGLCMSIAARVKQKNLFRNTVCAGCIRLLFAACKKTWKICKRAGEALWMLVRGIPHVWKTALVFIGICFLELMMYAIFYEDGYVAVFFFEKFILFCLILYAALNLRRLQRGGQALAQGDLSYQVDTKHMFWDFKGHGENLNRIADGMTAAVEQRMKSERMKTELITNVSHDIKTPLTSIINYADLIGKEPCENEKIKEYSEVLVRQSDRLKRLIEDLVEASKASTGNLEVLLSPCDAGIFLTQVSGEYELKLKEAGLELIISQPEKQVRVMTDGRRMLRIFDNLMNNVCKYAQRGTRVYLSLAEREETAEITLKNTSHAPLNLSADELMERFVRGDVSRNTEGNGLGLSIARSLAELQNGSLDLNIDGDLFKVTLRFPAIR